jgi:hypothetical protein
MEKAECREHCHHENRFPNLTRILIAHERKVTSILFVRRMAKEDDGKGEERCHLSFLFWDAYFLLLFSLLFQRGHL